MLYIASDFFRGGCCTHPTLYLKMFPPFVIFGLSGWDILATAVLTNMS